VEIPVKGPRILGGGIVEFHGRDEVPFPAEHVYLLGSCGVLGEGGAHAPGLEDATAVWEDLDSCSDLCISVSWGTGKGK
jgi:hypothetical protein